MSPRLPTSLSPLSPKMESLAIPSQQRRRPTPHQRQRSNGSIGPLRLPSLPRFHPANFPSQQSSAANTPVTGPNSPQPPLSPRSQQRQYSEAQRQLFLYQRELINNTRGSRASASAKPISPKLVPLAGSPGPVTPLELETQDGYLLVGQSCSTAPLTESMKGELVDKLIREEVRRRGEVATSPPRMTAAATSR